MHIRKLDNNRVGENINPKPNTPPNPQNCLMHISHKNNIKCPPWIANSCNLKLQQTCLEISFPSRNLIGSTKRLVSRFCKQSINFIVLIYILLYEKG